MNHTYERARAERHSQRSRDFESATLRRHRLLQRCPRLPSPSYHVDIQNLPHAPLRCSSDTAEEQALSSSNHPMPSSAGRPPPANVRVQSKRSRAAEEKVCKNSCTYHRSRYSRCSVQILDHGQTVSHICVLKAWQEVNATLTFPLQYPIKLCCPSENRRTYVLFSNTHQMQQRGVIPLM